MNADIYADGSPTAECFSECPHFETVSGSCNHNESQILVKYFIDNPGKTCPIYAEWRASQMAALARKLERGKDFEDRQEG